MQIEKFSSGTFLNQKGYKSFSPTPINTSWNWTSPEINVLLEQASSELGGLNSFSELIPNIDVYIQMHIRTEANKSSKIEGTKTSIEEDLMAVEDVAPEKRDDYEEVHNYINAMNHGIGRIQRDDFPLSGRLIRELHEILMRGVRGEHKTPGEFRTQQNWIGGTMPSNAIFVPPRVDELDNLLSDFEKFIHNDEHQIPHLIKIALIHYQFETIHPFQDGNGRIGRLIIPLYLLDKRILDKPCFYISDFFERNRTTYYDVLQNVRTKNDLTSWITFFLKAVAFTAKSAKHKFKKAVHLVADYEERMLAFAGKPDNNRNILKAFFNEPILTSKQLQNRTHLSQPTIDKTIRNMIEARMLNEITGYSRNRIFILTNYFYCFVEDSAELYK
jgi:Fic family protein